MHTEKTTTIRLRISATRSTCPGGKKVWLPFKHADLSDQHIAVANYLARIRVQSKDDLTAANIPPSPQQFHTKTKSYTANSAISKAKQELELGRFLQRKVDMKAMNLSYKTEAVPDLGAKSSLREADAPINSPWYTPPRTYKRNQAIHSR